MNCVSNKSAAMDRKRNSEKSADFEKGQSDHSPLKKTKHGDVKNLQTAQGNDICNFPDTTPGKFIKKFEYSPQNKENVSNFKSLKEVN